MTRPIAASVMASVGRSLQDWLTAVLLAHDAAVHRR